MKSVLLLLCSAATLAAAGSRYTEFRYGAFEIYTDIGDNEARAMLNELEQLRHVVGTLIGKQEPEGIWPIRIVHSKKQPILAKPVLARDSYIASLQTITPEFRAAIVRLLIDDNARRMPDTWELGLIEFLSTLEVDRTRVTLGAPPTHKTRDWSRVHMLSVDPQYSGKLRVLLSGLQQGLDRPTAFRNAFEQTPEQIEKNLNAYIEAGKYETVPFSSRPLDAKRQFYAREVDAAKASLIEGDLQFALNNTDGASKLYRAAANDDAVALATKDPALLAKATSGRALVEKASLASTPPAEKRAALTSAAALNKRWPEPHIRLAALETEAARKVPHLKKAAELQPRSAKAWETLALAQEEAGQLADAPKSWTMAERASQDSAEDARIQQARARSQELRVAQQIAEKEEARRKAEQELVDLRNRALRDIRAAEARANAGSAPIDKSKLDWYQEDKAPARVTGSLLRVDCLAKRAKLVLKTPDEATLSLLVVDPAKVVLSGGVQSLGCGVQKPVRTVVVLHNDKADSKLGTAGEVLSVEFR